MNQERITQEQTREFFIQTPSLVDYLPLTPHEFRLYSHYIRVCGDGGKCWQSVRTTAANARIGLGTVVRSRDALEDKYNLIYTDKHLIDDGDNINIVIRDIWPINSQFLAMVRRHGMPSLQVAEEWLLEQLQIDEMGTPFQSVEPAPENPDDHFKVGCSTEEHPVPQGNTSFHEGTHRALVEQDVPLWNRARAGGTPRSTVEPNKNYNNEIPDSQMDSNQISVIAAAAGGQLLKEKTHASEITSRARIGVTREEDGDDAIWWDQVGWVHRPAVEQVCLDYMSLDTTWRDQEHIIGNAEDNELYRLLLWLKRASWDEFAGVDNIPGYIRSRYQTERPQFSQRDLEELMGRINEYTEQDKLPF